MAEQVDVCIVGSGAGGAPMALELGRAGFKVVVIEKGAHYQPKDFVHDEILNSRRNFFMPLPWDEPHLLRAGTNAPCAICSTNAKPPSPVSATLSPSSIATGATPT